MIPSADSDETVPTASVMRRSSARKASAGPIPDLFLRRQSTSETAGNQAAFNHGAGFRFSRTGLDGERRARRQSSRLHGHPSCPSTAGDSLSLKKDNIAAMLSRARDRFFRSAEGRRTLRRAQGGPLRRAQGGPLRQAQGRSTARELGRAGQIGPVRRGGIVRYR